MQARILLEKQRAVNLSAGAARDDAPGRAPGNPAILLAVLLIEFPFLVYLFGLICLAVGGSLSGLIWPAALVGTLATLIALTLSRRSGLPAAVAVGSSFLMIVACFTLLCGAVFDISYDGQTYHQEAIIQLSRGWNPFLEEISDLYLVEQTALEAAINFYPKAPWVIASVHQLFFVKSRQG